MVELIGLSSLKVDSKNSRAHSDEQIERLCASIAEFGFVAPVLVAEDNTIIAGHGRVMAAKRSGLRDIPCVRVSHLTQAQRRAYVIADNKLQEGSSWNIEVLRAELGDLIGGGFNPDAMGFSEEDIDDVLRQEPQLTQQKIKLKPLRFTRILVSVPIGTEVDGLNVTLGAVVTAGGQVDYVGN